MHKTHSHTSGGNKLIKIKEAVIVEGKYDKIKVSSIIDAPIIETNGFRIFKDSQKRLMIKKLAQARGIVILTDSDSAGFVIRAHIKGIVKNGKVLNAYIPGILGKERRKPKPSKENLLGVEGVDIKCIENALKNSGVTIIESNNKVSRKMISKMDLYNAGFIGHKNSSQIRQQLLKELDLPKYITPNALVEVINCLFSPDEFKEFIKKLSY